jgi:hypothetical protein
MRRLGLLVLAVLLVTTSYKPDSAERTLETGRPGERSEHKSPAFLAGMGPAASCLLTRIVAQPAVTPRGPGRGHRHVHGEPRVQP